MSETYSRPPRNYPTTATRRAAVYVYRLKVSKHGVNSIGSRVARHVAFSHVVRACSLQTVVSIREREGGEEGQQERFATSRNSSASARTRGRDTDKRRLERKSEETRLASDYRAGGSCRSAILGGAKSCRRWRLIPRSIRGHSAKFIRADSGGANYRNFLDP